jgi:hypothetical protein
MKKLVLFALFVIWICLGWLLFGVAQSFAVGDQDVVLNVEYQGESVKEINGVTTIPFDSEYKIILRNRSDNVCSARIYIDGRRVCSFGDFIVHPRDMVAIERFVTDSLDNGKKLKFVPINHPEVDDPGDEHNGIVKVEFRREMTWEIDKPTITIPEYDSSVTMLNTDFTSVDILCNSATEVNNSLTTNIIPVSNIPANGATIAGSHSDQKFYLSEYVFEDKPFAELHLMIRGRE